MTLNSTAVLGEQAYGPYGNQRYTQGTIGTDKGYTGQFHDSVTGLDYYNARYYDPVVGLFLSPDDVQGNAQAMDPYTYVNGNPETLTDPTGQRVACGSNCGSGGPPTPNDCNADPTLSGCPGGGGSGNGGSGNTTKQTTGECAGLTSAQCNQAKAKVKNKDDWAASQKKLVGLVGSLVSLVLHAFPFVADFLSLTKMGGFTLKKLWETIGEGIPVFLDLFAIIGQIIAITGMKSLQWMADAVAGILNGLSSAYSAIKGLLDNKWISALADAGGFIAEGVVTLFTGGGSAALMTALSTLADGVWNKLKQQWSKEAFGAAGSVVASGFAAWTNFVQMQQDRCDNMSLAQVYAQGC